MKILDRGLRNFAARPNTEGVGHLLPPRTVEPCGTYPAGLHQNRAGGLSSFPCSVGGPPAGTFPRRGDHQTFAVGAILVAPIALTKNLQERPC